MGAMKELRIRLDDTIETLDQIVALDVMTDGDIARIETIARKARRRYERRHSTQPVHLPREVTGERQSQWADY